MPIRTDTLPYETPITFSNRFFHRFLLKNKVELKDEELSWRKGCDATDAIMKVLFSVEHENPKLNLGMLKAFSYPIKHKDQEYRYLAVPHPAIQFMVTDFYQKHKHDMLYYASRSQFSIRRPIKTSKYYYKEDSLHFRRLTNDETIIEQAANDYKTVRSFFVYWKYSNVHKFYESYTHHRCEKKYRKLCKLDITKCFDSIYTHSLPWAIFGKQSIKHDLGKSKTTFAGKFDKLMQMTNEMETNGIIIGPEFSRVFAELILQRVDIELESRLATSETKSLRHRKDYEMFRYVDDFFIFYNDDIELKLILSTLQPILAEYKLHLNPNKQEIYSKPIITSMSQAKHQISDFLNRSFGYGKIRQKDIVPSKSAITEFKSIIKRCDVEYKDMLNYSLAAVEQRCEILFKEHLENDQGAGGQVTEESKDGPTKSLTEIVEEIDPEKREFLTGKIRSLIEFSFFIYSVSPRTNTTIRLCRILRLILTFLKETEEHHYQKDQIFKLIFDNTTLVLRKEKLETETQVETLSLLILLAELGKKYALEESVLAEYFNVPVAKDDEQKYDCIPKERNPSSDKRLNYWSITVLLFYMRRKRKYARLRKAIRNLIKYLLTSGSSENRKKQAELSLLFFDILACPYVDDTLKHDILISYDIKDCNLRQKLVSGGNRGQFVPLCFTNWNQFDFGKELDTKKSAQVY